MEKNINDATSKSLKDDTLNLDKDIFWVSSICKGIRCHDEGEEKCNYIDCTTKRDLIQELSTIGLTSEQCCKILDWTETLPIHLFRKNTQAYIKQGVVKIEPTTKHNK